MGDTPAAGGLHTPARAKALSGPPNSLEMRLERESAMDKARGPIRKGQMP